MFRTLDNCKVIHHYGYSPAQQNGICEGFVFDGELHIKCQTCYLHDINNARKVCVECGKEFISIRPNAKVCSAECKLARNRKYNYEKHSKKKQTLDDTLKEIAEYNRKNGTHLTYGKYKEMKYFEKMKGAGCR